MHAREPLRAAEIPHGGNPARGVGLEEVLAEDEVCGGEVGDPLDRFLDCETLCEF